MYGVGCVSREDLEVEVRKLRMSLQAKERELEELKRELREREERIKELEARLPELVRFEDGGWAINGFEEIMAEVWEILNASGIRRLEATIDGVRVPALEISGGKYDGFVVASFKGSWRVMPKETFERHASHVVVAAPFDAPRQKLSGPLRDALAKMLAQYFDFYEFKHKLVVFMLNLLPLVRLAGIEVGDPRKVRPFKVFAIETEDGEERLAIYTPEEAFRGWLDAQNSGSSGGYVNGVYLSLAAIEETLLGFMNYAVQKVAETYPDVLRNAVNLAARAIGKLPKSSLSKLAAGRPEEAGEEEGSEEGESEEG